MTDKISFRQAIAAQPEALRTSHRAVTARLDEVDLAPFAKRSIALVGIGASLYAAYAGAAQMRRQGLRASAFPGTDLYDPTVDAADIYVALSASGRSVEPARAMELRAKATTIGIAKSVETPLGAVVGTMIGTQSGADSGPNTTSYFGSLQALGLLADRLGTPASAEWEALPERVATILEKATASVARASELLAGRTSIDCVGAGTAFGTAGYAALLIREAVRVPAQHWDTLNFLHGPMEPNDPRTGIILFGEGREIQLATDLAGFGIPTLLVTSREDVADKTDLVVLRVPTAANGLCEAVLQGVPVQLLTATLAEAAGLPECNFRYRQTDTKLALKSAA